MKKLIYRAIYVALVAVALVLDFEFLQGRANWYYLNYYTILSNIACLVFFTLALFHPQRITPRAEGAITFCIAITGIIYATMLAPADIAEGHFFNFENIVLHYVAPIMVILDWLLFCPKGRLRTTDPLLWLCIPLSYFGYILVRSTFAGNIGNIGSRFPYGFIDPAIQGGWGPMLQGVAFIALGMLALGYLIFLLDRLILRFAPSGNR